MCVLQPATSTATSYPSNSKGATNKVGGSYSHPQTSTYNYGGGRRLSASYSKTPSKSSTPSRSLSNSSTSKSLAEVGNTVLCVPLVTGGVCVTCDRWCMCH